MRRKERKRENKKERKKKRKKKGECRRDGGKRDMERGEEKKKGTTLPLAISGKSAFKTHRGKRQSWSTQREPRVGTKNYGFCRIPKGRGFSYTGYFLPRSHVRVILVHL